MTSLFYEIPKDIDLHVILNQLFVWKTNLFEITYIAKKRSEE